MNRTAQAFVALSALVAASLPCSAEAKASSQADCSQPSLVKILSGNLTESGHIIKHEIDSISIVNIRHLGSIVSVKHTIDGKKGKLFIEEYYEIEPVYSEYKLNGFQYRKWNSHSSYPFEVLVNGKPFMNPRGGIDGDEYPVEDSPFSNSCNNRLDF